MATDSKQKLENSVNRVAVAIKNLGEDAKDHRTALTAETAEKITNYLRIQIETLGEDLKRLAHVPPPGQFSLDANIPAPRPPIPSGPVYREAEPVGRLVGQRKAGAPAPSDDDVGFIQE